MQLVSIIVPIYNTEKYLAECIDSLIKQTYKNIEIILVNDGSPDNCDEICKEYAQKYDNIKYFYQENKGVSAARNFGLSQATGDYIYFMDSDDTINDIFIESSIKIAEKENADVVIVGLNNISMTKHYTKEDYLTTAFTWEVLFKRSLILKYSEIRFQNNMQYNEDTIFIHQLLCVSDKISFNNNALYNYRIRKGQLTKQLCKNPLYSLKQTINCLEDFYTDHLLMDNYKEYFIELIIVNFIPKYWNCKFIQNEKILFFHELHTFFKKYNIIAFETKKSSRLSRVMTQRFIKCKKWQDFEKYLILIEIFKFFKKLFKGELYNA